MHACIQGVGELSAEMKQDLAAFQFDEAAEREALGIRAWHGEKPHSTTEQRCARAGFRGSINGGSLVCGPPDPCKEPTYAMCRGAVSVWVGLWGHFLLSGWIGACILG